MACPDDYASAEGDVLGGGLVGGLQENTIDECTTECENRSDCYSFLYSPSTKHCKLMKERKPEASTSTPQPDYVFCRRNIVRKSLLKNINHENKCSRVLQGKISTSLSILLICYSS